MDILTKALLIGGVGAIGYAAYKLSAGSSPLPDNSVWARGDVLQLSQDGQFSGIITLAEVVSSGHYRYWVGWYGHTGQDLYPIQDWTLHDITDATLAEFNAVLMGHVDLP